MLFAKEDEFFEYYNGLHDIINMAYAKIGEAEVHRRRLDREYYELHMELLDQGLNQKMAEIAFIRVAVAWLQR